MRHSWTSTVSVATLTACGASHGASGTDAGGAATSATTAVASGSSGHPTAASSSGAGTGGASNSSAAGAGGMTSGAGGMTSGTGGAATSTSSAGTGGTCAGYMSCAAQGVACGLTPDGCGNVLQCGACTGNLVCVEGKCSGTCTPAKTCAGGANCGAATDGCGGVIVCGGACPPGETCGALKPNACGIGTCTRATCASQNLDCGVATDGCGGVLSCGTCPIGTTCGGGGPNVCGNAGPDCVGLCLQQTICAGGATTSVSGTVYAPNGTDPLPNVLVYVPNAAVSAFTPGVSCGACGSNVSGSPLVSAVTAIDGSFKITNMPVGASIPLVIQDGRWRRQVVIPTVTACADTPVAATLTHMPENQSQGDIPLMAFVTGAVDALECVMRKIGIQDSEFTDPTGAGRVRFYLGSGEAGARISAATPVENALWGTPAAIDQYDIVYFSCQGAQFARSAASQQVVIDYANAGGRVFATHYSYVWLYDAAPFSTTATWAVNLDGATFAADPGIGIINQGFPSGANLAAWLTVIGASTTPGQMPINTLRHDFTGVAAAPTAYLWITDDDPTLGTVPMHYTFDTPVGAPATQQCGRVLFDDFHVENADENPTTGMTFPAECAAGAMTPQEKMLEYMIFDLGSCVTPPVACTPSTCAAQSVVCGPVGDGCGNILQCGACAAGSSCIAGACASGCAPQTCASQGFACGAQGDGCGNVLACGSCPVGSCSKGHCITGSCQAMTACPAGDTCGTINDGCSGVLSCGACPAGQGSCGGGGTPYQCGSPACTSKTCAQQDYDCGMATDGCGNVINCGSCVSPQVCGAGSPAKPNVCGGSGS